VARLVAGHALEDGLALLTDSGLLASIECRDLPDGNIQFEIHCKQLRSILLFNKFPWWIGQIPIIRSLWLLIRQVIMLIERDPKNLGQILLGLAYLLLVTNVFHLDSWVVQLTQLLPLSFLLILVIFAYIAYKKIPEVFDDKLIPSFRWHGAEHMVTNCSEAGKPLTVNNVRQSSTYSSRCGTSLAEFMVLFLVTNCFILSGWVWFSLIFWTEIWMILSRFDDPISRWIQERVMALPPKDIQLVLAIGLANMLLSGSLISGMTIKVMGSIPLDDLPLDEEITLVDETLLQAAD